MKKLILLLSLLPLTVMANPKDQDKTDCQHRANQMKKFKQAGDKPFYLRGLELTDSQQAQIKALSEKRRADNKVSQQQAFETKRALSELTMSDAYDAKAVEKLIDEQTVAQKNRAMAQAEYHHQIYQLLTTEQKATLVERMQKMQQKHQVKKTS